MELLQAKQTSDASLNAQGRLRFVPTFTAGVALQLAAKIDARSSADG